MVRLDSWIFQYYLHPYWDRTNL